jgi:deoxyribose-phosphate aldolase
MKINSFIDYTALKPTTSAADIALLCQTAIEQQYRTVCVSPYYVREARTLLVHSPVQVCTVIGFPSGMNTLTTKMQEAKELLEEGADELDMVVNIAALKAKDSNYLRREIRHLVELCHKYEAMSKLIIESGLLSVDELKYICDICNNFELNFVKTSTGFNGQGAELEKVKLMREFLRPELAIKASGGIKDYETACTFIKAGAMRIGTSAKIENK